MTTPTFRRLSAGVGAGVTAASLLAAPGAAAGAGAGTCPTPTEERAAIAREAAATPGVRAATAAWSRRSAALRTARARERAARLALARSLRTRGKADDVVAKARVRAAARARALAVRSERAARSRRDAVLAAAVAARTAWHRDHPCTEVLEPPSGLGAVAGNDVVTLQWDAVPDAPGYLVHRDGALVGWTTQTSFEDVGARNGSTYSYTVRTLDRQFVSPDSVAVTATPSLPAPDGVTATASRGRVDLTWSPVPHATGYELRRDGAVIGTAAATSYGDSGLTGDLTYTYTVTALEGTVPSAPSAPVSATTPVVLPGKPTGLAATRGDTRVALRWTATPEATGYQVVRGGVVVATPATPAFTDTGLANGTTYTYLVRATNRAGTSSDSDEVQARPLPPVPAVPTGLAAAAGDAKVVLSWTTVPGAASYQVRRGGSTVATVTAPSYTDNGLTNGTTYSYTVRASNIAGTSSSSSAVTATPAKPVAAPASPGAPVAVAGDGTVALSWTAVAGATSYQVRRGGTVVTTTAGTTWTDTGLTNGTTYVYDLVAVNDVGSSGPSATATATPHVTVAAPGAPTGLTASAGNAQVVLTWSAASGATGYQVRRGGAVIATTSALTWTDTGLANGVAVTYDVVATNAGGSSAPTASVTVTPVAPVALAAPTGLAAGTATALNTGAFRLTWVPVPGATGYQVLRDGTALGTTTAASYTPASTSTGVAQSYTVVATNGTAVSTPSAPLSATLWLGSAVNDALGRTVYGQIQVRLVMTPALASPITGCWATYPTTSDSGSINKNAIPKLCTQVLTTQPSAATVASLITNVSGASATSPAFRTSLQNALTQAGR